MMPQPSPPFRSSEPANGPGVDRHIALLIDADNVSSVNISAILAELSKYGTPNIRRAYGDWTDSKLKGWKSKLHEFAIRPIQQFSYTSGKNATDIALVIDALELLYTQSLSAFCIASSDADFTPLVMHLRGAGKSVYGFGERKTPDPFVNACTTFLYLEGLTDTDELPAVAPKLAKTAATKVAASQAPAKKPVTLAQNTKLVTILRGAVAAAAREDGWALLSTAGGNAKRQSSIDPRNYGAKTFTALFEATGLFDIVKREDGQNYVSDKRNKERSPKPWG